MARAGACLLAAVAVFASSGGCGSDSGVLLSVTAANVRLDELQFEIGVARDGVFLRDQEVSGQRVTVTGRSLQTQPFQLLLHQPSGTTEPFQIRALVLGRQRDADGVETLVAAGAMKPAGSGDQALGTEQTFMPGKLLRRLVELRGGRAVTFPPGCVAVQIDDATRLTVTEGDNRDCDPVRSSDDPPDCDDDDAEVYPGALERCDGKDNNCDQQLGPSVGLCYGHDGDGQPCRLGTRSCEEPSGGPGTCVLAGDPVAEAYCAAFADCEVYADPSDCIASRVQLRQISCELQVQDNAIPCPGGSVELPSPLDAATCSWSIVGAGGLSVDFGADGISSSDTCVSTLRVGASDASVLPATATAEVFVDGAPAMAVELAVTAVTVTSCDPQPLLCQP